MTKQVKLRAFEITNSNISKSVQLTNSIKQKQNSPSSNERRMLLSADDPKRRRFNILL